MRRFAGLEPRRTPWSKTAGTGVTPVEMEAGDGHDLRPCRDMGALGPGRRDRDARSSLAQDGRREASLSLLPLWLRAAPRPPNGRHRWEVRQSGEEREGSDDQGA